MLGFDKLMSWVGLCLFLAACTLFSPSTSAVLIILSVLDDALANDTFWKLASRGPAFCVEAENIDIVYEPATFYQQLLVSGRNNSFAKSASSV